MAKSLQDIYNELLNVRTYLIKVGPDRRQTGQICEKKLKEANIIYVQFNAYLDLIQEDLAHRTLKDIAVVASLIDKIKNLYSDIQKLCIHSTKSDEINSFINMEKFDLKTALSLLPAMNDQDSCTKQLIDGISYYDSILETDSKSKLISFVLLSRLSQSAKLRLAASYDTVSELLTDMRNNLLPKKSATALQRQMLLLRQNEATINDFGKQLSEMFVDLTIAQSEGKSETFKVLQPLNEKQAIKQFADGLRNRRLSTIITAQNFTSLKDAIQAALDAEVTSPSSEEVMAMRYYNNSLRNFKGQYFRGPGSRPYGSTYNPVRLSNRYSYQQGNPERVSQHSQWHGTQRQPQGRYRGRSRSFHNTTIRTGQLNMLSESEPEVQPSTSQEDVDNQLQFFRT